MVQTDGGDMQRETNKEYLCVRGVRRKGYRKTKEEMKG